MARGRNKQTDETEDTGETEEKASYISNMGDRHTTIRTKFAKAYRLEQELKAAMKKHIEPIKKEQKSLWRALKAETDIPITVLKNEYNRYSYVKKSTEREDDGGEAARVNIQDIYSAFADENGQLDWTRVFADEFPER